MRQPLRRVRHGPNQPIRRRLPHRVQQPKANIKQHAWGVSITLNPRSLRIFFRMQAPSRIIPRVASKSDLAGPVKKKVKERTSDNTTPKYGRP